MDLNLNCLPDDAVHISGFGGEYAGVMDLDVVPEADAVLCCGWIC
jgi:hypothetical protein